MSSPLVFFEDIPHVVLRKADDWGIEVFDLAAPPRRLSGSQRSIAATVRTQIDPYQTKQCPTPAELLRQSLTDGDTWSAMTRRSLARFEAFFLTAEDPQRRLDARDVVTLAHQVSLVRHILDTPGRRRVLIGDEVGLGKTVVAGLIIQELLEANPSQRILYLAPARLVSNVGREFKRLNLHFREWKAQEGDARLDTDSRIIASIHRAVHPNHFGRLISMRPWDVIVVDECHHLSDWAEGGGDPVMKYRLVRDLVAAQSQESCLILLSGTPHQAHAARFDNLLRLLQAPGENQAATAGRVIYRTKEDVRDWEGNPLFPPRKVNSPIVVELDPEHRAWLAAIHRFFQPLDRSATQAVQRAAGWKCAQALQWAASSPNAGLGYLVRQALRADWDLNDAPLAEAIAALRPYRSGAADEPVDSVFRRLKAEIRRQAVDDDVEDIEEDVDAGAGVDHAALADLIKQGIALVRSPRQLKWQRLWDDLLASARGEKIVLFAQPIETVLALATWLQKKTGQRPSIIIGGQSDAERDKQVDAFRSHDGPQFLISSRAGGEGINLQFSRRLVHLDVPWNPMDMEQRVGRVHRFGSRETVLVDTIVVRDSRETDAWKVARDRLRNIAQALVAPDRFETVFSRVMCLIPPEELQTVLINSPAFPLAEPEIQQLASLVDSGFRDWQSFHERYAANQRNIRDQPGGLARWRHLRDFLIRQSGAQLVSGISKTRFEQRDGSVRPVEHATEVLKLADDSLRLVGDFDGGLFSGATGQTIEPLGLNIPPVADLLAVSANPRIATGAAHVRWGEAHEKLRNELGDEVVVLVFALQAIRIDTVGGFTEAGFDLRAYAIRPEHTLELTAAKCAELFGFSDSGTIRVRPMESGLHERATQEELRLLNDLRKPSEQAVRNRIRYAVWPILALHISP